MQNARCSKCGHETAPDGVCHACTQTNGDGVAEKKRVKPPPPAELADTVFDPVPPEMAEEFRRTFNEEEFLAAVRELERTGGVQIDDLIAEMDRRLDGSV